MNPSNGTTAAETVASTPTHPISTVIPEEEEEVEAGSVSVKHSVYGPKQHLQQQTQLEKKPESTQEVAVPLMETLPEPYMSLLEIAATHPESFINVDDVEMSLGLTSQEAARRLLENGKNVLTPPAKMPEWKRFLMQFKNMFMVLLNTCALLSIVAFALQDDYEDKTNLYLAIVLIVVVFATCFLQFHEEGKANSIMDSFSKMLAVEANVLRNNGRQMQVPVADLVVGDLVIIKDGDKVPADLVLLLCRGLKAECSSLTGEAEPISCSDAKSKEGTRIFECKNMCFSSSLCFDGTAIGLVVRTGDNTVCV